MLAGRSGGAGAPKRVCSADGWETVDDVLPDTVSVWTEDAYRISFDVPEDAVVSAFSENGAATVYEQADGDYEITAQVLLSSDADGAIRRLSGFDPEQLEVLNTRRCGLPESQFAWYATGEEGGRLCRADILRDGDHCYALTFSVREELAPQYAELAQHVFESFSLNADKDF